MVFWSAGTLSQTDRKYLKRDGRVIRILVISWDSDIGSLRSLSCEASCSMVDMCVITSCSREKKNGRSYEKVYKRSKKKIMSPYLVGICTRKISASKDAYFLLRSGHVELSIVVTCHERFCIQTVYSVSSS